MTLFRLDCPGHLEAAKLYENLPEVAQSLQNEAYKSPREFRTFTDDDLESVLIGCSHDEHCDLNEPNVELDET